MRTFLGFLIAAVALAGALYLHADAKFHAHHYDAAVVTGTLFGNPVEKEERATIHRKASWQDPLALFIAVAGVGAGAGVILRR